MASNSTKVRSMRRHVKTYVLVVAVLIVAAALGFFSADAQQNGAPMQAPGVNNFTQNFLAQHEIGRRFHIDPADLPPPKSGPIVHNGPLIIPYSGRCRRYPRASRRYRLRLGSSIRDVSSFCPTATSWWPNKAPVTLHYCAMMAAGTPHGLTVTHLSPRLSTRSFAGPN